MEHISSWSIFVRPLSTLDSLREQPRWLYAALISGMIAAAVNGYVIQRIGLVRMIELTTHAKGMIDPQAILQNAAEHTVQILCFQAGSMVVSSVVIALAIATVLWLLLALCGFEMTLRQGLAVVAHVHLLSVALRECMMVLTVWLTQDPGQLDLNNPLATNPAFFLKPVSPVAAKFLVSLDLITFVNIALLIVGFTRVCPKLSTRAASILVVVPWTFYIGTTLAIKSFMP